MLRFSKWFLISVLFTVLILPVLAGAETWVIDPVHTTAAFRVRHMMVSWVRGEFGKVEGTVQFEPDKLETIQIDVTIDASSIDTRHEKRDSDLRSERFLHVEKYPSITFESKRVQNIRADSFEMVGDLTIRGVTKEVVLVVEELSAEVKDPGGNLRRGASARTTINRNDFGLVWNKLLETGGVLVGDEVHILIEVELIKQS